MLHRIYYSLLTRPLPDEFTQQVYALLPPADLQKMLSYKFWQDRHTTLMGRLLLSRALSEHGIPGNPLNSLKYTSLGKPWLEGNHRFNISHSGLLTAVVVTSGCETGIDVEQNVPVNPADFIECFTPAEYQQILSATDYETEFYRLWTRKEAFLKAIGTGLSLPLNQVDALSNVKYNDAIWYLHPINLAEGYLCHLATACPHPVIELHEWSPDMYVFSGD